MNKVLIIILPVFFILGCQKKSPPLEKKQEPLAPEIYSLISNASLENYSSTNNLGQGREEIFLPPPGPYKPTNKQIQLALKNTNFYKGEIDGVIGPKTLQAIKDFQAKHNLTVDGKVGPKTWQILSQYLNTSDSPSLSEYPKN